MKVVATRRGYYDDVLWRVGDVFTLRDARDFSPRWMVVVDERRRERRHSAQDAIDVPFLARHGVRPRDVVVSEAVDDRAHRALRDGDPFA